MDLPWIKSSSCESNTCIEVARLDDKYLIKDSKTHLFLVFNLEEWNTFVTGIRAGDFDL
jgi:Domain of unknown function (DUF397)